MKTALATLLLSLWSSLAQAQESPSVPPGDFASEVVAIDSSGQDSPPARLPLLVAPDFHVTVWFTILVTFTIVGMAFSAYRLRVRAVEARNEEVWLEIFERRTAQEALHESRRVLRVVSRRLLTAQDEERRFIARELHDDLTQRLAALSIQAEVLEDRMGAFTDANRQLAHDLALTAQSLATDIQQISRRLHPASLTELGLMRAMRSECAAFAKREGIDVEFDATKIEAELSPEVTLSVFRILQESLHNVAKHARATHVEVNLHPSNGTLNVDIVDSGCGFDREQQDEAGIGLVCMDERARSIGGRLTVHSKPGEGTGVHLSIPVRNPE